MKNKLLRLLKMVSYYSFIGICAQVIFINLIFAENTIAQKNKNLEEVRFNIELQNANVENALMVIEQKTKFRFTFERKDLDPEVLINYRGNKVSLKEVLLNISKEASLGFRQINYNIDVRKLNDRALKNNVARIEVVQDDIDVTGKVTSTEDGEGLPGVNVIVKGTTQGTVTDVNGDYKINVPSTESVLVFSSVGYITQEVPIGSKTTIDLTLSPDVKSLQEIVVIGYGSVKKGDLTGSVSQVNNEELETVPVYNMEQALKGHAAGVQVTQNSGQPGGRVEVRIRGGNSMIGSNQPLYVVDGFPITGGIDFLNPEDIESIDILKDASATAIYGARGANGVVIITSKRGKAGQKGTIEVSGLYGVQQASKRYDLLDAKQYAVIANEWLKNGGLAPYFNVDEVQNPGTNWQDVVLRTAPIQNYTISFSGSSDKTRYALSGNYFGQDGILINTGVKRGSLRLNLDHELNNWLKMTVNMNLSRSDEKSVPVNNGNRGSGSIWSAAIAAPPTLPIYDENGLPTQIEKFYNFGSADMRNPLIFAQQQTTSLSNNVLGNTTFEIKLTKDLSFKTLLGLEYANTLNDYFSPIIFENDRGSGSQTSYYRSSFLNENTLRYSKTFNDIHTINVVAGYTYQTDLNRNFGVSESGYSNNTTKNYDLSAAETINPPSSGYSQWTLASWLGRVNYSLNSKYLFTASIRADGSSRFGADHKWGFFPSGAFAWRASDEAFMQNVGFISDLKFRVSYGLTGNTALSPYQSLNRLSSVTYIYANQADVIGYVPSGISNTDLRWETTAQFDIGFDFGILENRLRFTADYYNKKTSDLLASVPLPPSVGFGSILQNVGEIQNQGIEFSAQADILTHEVKWNVSAQISANKNKVLRLAGGSDILSAGQFALWSSTNIAREGEPLGSFYGLLEDGLDENGFIKYKDINDDGVINTLDKVILGKPYPDFIYGLNSNLSYKNFELNIFLEGVQGNQIFNSTGGSVANSFQRGTNQIADLVGNYWTTENPDPNAKYPKISAITAVDISDRFIENGSYLRIRSIRLAYNLPVGKLGIQWFNRVQLYLSGTNLFTFTKYTGLDPEVNSKGVDSQDVSSRLLMGYDQSSYPNAKSYTAGLKLNF